MWKEVGKCLEKMGIKNPIEILEKEVKDWDKPKENVKPVPLNKVGEYCEGEDGNTTLPIEYKGVKTTAILDSGAGVVIATKASSTWEKWGKPALRKTRLKLQLANGHIEQPMGIIEQVVMTSCGIDDIMWDCSSRFWYQE